MRKKLIKIGMSVLNTTVGAFKSNADLVIDAMDKMTDCTIGCFNELTLCGYPPEDLVQWPAFEHKQWRELERIKAKTLQHDQKAVYFIGLMVCHLDNIYNCIAVLHRGKILGLVPKFKLPTYNIFQEGRAISEGIPYWLSDYKAPDGELVPFGDQLFGFDFGTVGIPICETMWTPETPMRYSLSSADILITPSSSPYRIGVQDTRRELLATRSGETQTTVVYINQVGGNGSVIFDGGAFVYQCGKQLFEAPRGIANGGVYTQVVDMEKTSRLRRENSTWRREFHEYQRNCKTVAITELPGLQGTHYGCYPYPFPANKSFFLPDNEQPRNKRELFFDELEMVCVLALGDYFGKTKAFKRLLISLSGGKDSVISTVFAWLYAKQRFAGLPEADAAAAIDDFVRCYSWPTRHNSRDTKNISKELCKALGLTLHEQSIQKEYELELQQLQAALRPGEEITRLCRQNAQAGIRGQRMNRLANCTGGLWIQTGNMSEKFAGYTTVGGDLMGAYSLICNLPKTVVIAFLEYLKGKYNLPLDKVIKAASSAELEDNQEDEKDLLPFPIWDACMYLVLEEKMVASEVQEIVRAAWSDNELAAIWPDYVPGAGMLEGGINKLFHSFFRSIFKWVVAPEGAHLGKLDLDHERTLQIPVVQSSEWFFEPK